MFRPPLAAETISTPTSHHFIRPIYLLKIRHHHLKLCAKLTDYSIKKS